MREVEGYRDQLEVLLNHFGDVGIVTQKSVADYTGRSQRWVKDRLGIGKNGITLPALARRLLEVCG